MKKLVPNKKLKEMKKYIINDFNNCQCNTHGLFDDNISNNGHDGFGFYWGDNSNFIDITIKKNCSVWVLSGNSYYDFNGKLDILKYDGSKFVNSNIIENLRSDKILTWTKTINFLPKGRYKFIKNNNAYYRFDSEWYFEDLESYKYLIQNNDKYYSLKDEYFKDNKYSSLDIDKLDDKVIKQYGFNDIDTLLQKVKIGNGESQNIGLFNDKIKILSYQEE